MKDTAGKFQIRVGERTLVVGCGQLLLDVEWKWEAPQHRVWCGALWRRPKGGAGRNSVGHRKQHASGAYFDSVMQAMHVGLNGNEFSQTCGTQVEVMVYVLKSSNIWCRIGKRRIRCGPASAQKRFLQQIKEAAGSRERNGHGAKLPQYAVSFF